MPFLPSSHLAALSESWLCTCSFFPINRTSLQHEVPWWHGAMLAWDGMLQTRWNCLPFILNGYSQVSSPSILKFLQWTPELSQSWLLLIFGGLWGLGGGDARTILVMSIWWILLKALPLPQPKLLVFTWFFLSLLFSFGYKWLSYPCLYSRHSLPPHWSNCLMILLDRYPTRAPTQNCQSHRGHPSHREAFPTVPSIMNDITTFPAARARIWEPSLTSCFPSCSPVNLFIKLIPFLKSPGYS